MSFEDASVLPLCLDTAAHGLYSADILGIPLPTTSPTPAGKAVFVYGGSSSVGACTIQLARASGYDVVTTASKHNFDLCKSLGAKHVFDYRDANFKDEAAAVLKSMNVIGAYDAISEKGTIEACAEVLEKAGGPKIIAAALPGSEQHAPAGYKVVPVSAVLVASAKSVDNVVIGPYLWEKYFPQALENGSLLAKPDAKVVGNGLGDIQKAMDEQRKGVSAVKIVVSL